MAFQEGAFEGTTPRSTTEVSPWAVSFLILAAALMVIGGIFHFIEGQAAVINDDFFVVVRGYAFDMDVSTWGWIHMVGGVIVTLAGIALLSGALWARIVAILVVMASAMINFLTVPYYPVWALIMLVIDGGILWALIAHGRDLSEA
jgi:hypothetical protein